MNLLYFCDELLLQILHGLSARDLSAFVRVNKKCWCIGNDSGLWKHAWIHTKTKVSLVKDDGFLSSDPHYYQQLFQNTLQTFDTVQEAINATEEHTHVSVHIRPGTYTEGLIVSKDSKHISFIGHNETQNDIVIKARKTALSWEANSTGTVKNLTLLVEESGVSKHSGVFVNSGSVHLFNCDISSHSGNGIGVDSKAKAHIEGCRVHHCKEVGFLVTNNSFAHIHNNDIYSNGFSNIICSNSGECTVSNNRIFNGEQCGVYLHDKGSALLSNNRIYNNKFMGVCAMRSNVNILDNHVFNNDSIGISIQKNSTANLAKNIIANNVYFGVYISGKTTTATIEHCQIKSALSCGLVFSGVQKSFVSHCDIGPCAKAGVYLRKGADALFRHNSIHDMQISAIFTRNKSKGHFQENCIFNCEKMAVEIIENCSPVFARNEIHHCKSSGIYIHFQGAGLYIQNNLHHLGGEGIFVDQNCRADLVKNRSSNINLCPVPEPVLKAIQSQKCTFVATGEEYTNQALYHCRTCKLINEYGLCQACLDKCHKGHDVYPSPTALCMFYCDCGKFNNRDCCAK